jgi:hypothetical protein
MRIFISHIHQEAPAASVLKDWFESTFPTRITAFVSSDPTSLPAGSRWLEHLESELNQTGLLVALLSPASVDRHWLTFEAGCAWIRKIPIIPICHSGLDLLDLPQPLPQFQALNAADPKFGEKLFSAIAQHAKLGRSPRVAHSEFQNEFSHAAASCVASQEQASPTSPTISPASILSEHQVSTLKTLAAAKDRGHPRVVEANLAKSAGLGATRFAFEVKQLADRNLVHTLLRVGGPVEYSISDDGIAFLVLNGHVS